MRRERYFWRDWERPFDPRFPPLWVREAPRGLARGLRALREALPDAPSPREPRLVPDVPRLVPDAPRLVPDAPRLVPDAPRLVPDVPRGDADFFARPRAPELPRRPVPAEEVRDERRPSPLSTLSRATSLLKRLGRPDPVSS